MRRKGEDGLGQFNLALFACKAPYQLTILRSHADSPFRIALGVDFGQFFAMHLAATFEMVTLIRCRVPLLPSYFKIPFDHICNLVKEG